MLNPDDALTLAINLLRDSSESRRMPSGGGLEPDVAAVHEEAADCLELLRHQIRTSQLQRDG